MPAQDPAPHATPHELVDGEPARERRGRWVRPSEAARLLGVSERTVRRRVASGQYAVQRTGRNARVRLPAEALAAATEQEADASYDATVLALARAVDALQEALTAERGRSQRLEGRLEQLEQERIRLLSQLGRMSGGQSSADGATNGSAAAAEARPAARSSPA